VEAMRSTGVLLIALAYIKARHQAHKATPSSGSSSAITGITPANNKSAHSKKKIRLWLTRLL
jgi:hypothetical protein